MKEIAQRKSFSICIIATILIFSSLVSAGETQWMAVGDLHDWYHSAGCEIEVGRTFLIPDQQDGLRWPAVYVRQDCKAAKAMWIGVSNYQDPLIDELYQSKVVHVGPRVLDEETETMPQEFRRIGRFEAPQVLVDGIPATQLSNIEVLDEVDENLPSDRMIYNVVNTSVGITVTRKIYAFSQKNHSNYLIYDYVFRNTGIIDKNMTTVQQTLEGVIFYFQYRYAPTREAGVYGPTGGWTPQSSSWGHATMNDVVGTVNTPDFMRDSDGSPLRGLYSWYGSHSQWTGEGTSIGAPNIRAGGDGHLGAAQYVGNIVLHCDTSPQDPTDDVNQPFTTTPLDSDNPITQSNSQFNAAKMAEEYAYMKLGHPDPMHADGVDAEGPGTGFANLFGNTPGGFSQCHGFGPYTLAPGDSIHIVIAEGVTGLSRQKCYEIGDNWINSRSPYRLPDGSTTTDKEEYKNTWVWTGQDSIYQLFRRAKENFANGISIPNPPPPPETFEVTSGGDRIILSWSNNAESWPNFAGYRVYRAIFKPDTTFDLIYECGQGTANPQIVNEYPDVTPRRGFDYYYYITSFDNGSTNDYFPGVPLESSKFYTRTTEPAFLRRPPGKSLSDIRVVPNPYSIRARDIQFGLSGPDRITFFNIPPTCTIKIYTERGDLINTLEHTDGSGDEPWNSTTSSRQVVVSGVYIAVIEVSADYDDPESGVRLFTKGDKEIIKFVIIR
jgi:hypothetical protein